MIHVLIAEDHVLVRAGIHALLEKNSDIHVVGEASDGIEAVEMARELKPDVLLMDIMMPRLNGIQAAGRLQEEKISTTKVLLLSMHSDTGFVYQALQKGVKGYILKSSVSDELITAIRTVASGKTYLSEPISEIVLESVIKSSPSSTGNPLDGLSPREREILQLIAEEHTSSEIAQMLFISEKTVEKHRANLMEKLNVRNMAGLVRAALKYHLTDLDITGGA